MGLTQSDMQEKYIKIHDLKVSNKLYDFVNNELLKDTEITPENFWEGFDNTVKNILAIVLRILV